ncbi:HD domain-containing protein [Phormidium sp. CCY1219]|uniref:HD domain-containing protein n=1 Tax=Phormidium sp. CCY1219 TaxID=2886104 RepID=UPI002D1F06B3|nr:HD domain-containing protein [Phormidium sp. CCY1219]MEB3826086.1 HD domain-containing protein [Phormidium sp. CCY1219]
MDERLGQQIQFAIEIDKLKGVLRQTLLADGSRQENSAEHSWHLAMMAMLLQEYAPKPVDLLRVIKMLLVHDLVEVYAGDTFCYDLQGNLDKAAREAEAAEKLFGILPALQGLELRELWQEFEENATANAQFATALDRLQPLLQNRETEGATWKMHGINAAQVRDRMSPVQEGIPALWPLVQQIIEEAMEKGYLKE